MGASSNWAVTDADFPVNGSTREKLGFATKHATLAYPSPLRQLWEFRVTDRFVELFAASASVMDPEGRKAMIGSGMALEYLKLALRQHGCCGRMDLFPDLDQPTLAARVHAGCAGAHEAQERVLFDAMKMREARTSWPGQFPVSDAALVLLGQGMAGERAWLEFARSEPSRQRILELAGAHGRLQVKAIRVQNPTLMMSGNQQEAAELSSMSSNRRFARWRRPLLAIKLRATAMTTEELPEADDWVTSNGNLAVLKTKTDDKQGWLAAGQTLARLFLRARALGVNCSSHLDALQRPDARAELRAAIGHKGFAQAILHCAASRLEGTARSGIIYPTTVSGNSG